jgi:hypothetical protein
LVIDGVDVEVTRDIPGVIGIDMMWSQESVAIDLYSKLTWDETLMVFRSIVEAERPPGEAAFPAKTDLGGPRLKGVPLSNASPTP